MRDKAPTGTNTETQYYEAIGGGRGLDRLRYQMAKKIIKLKNLLEKEINEVD